MQNIKILPTPSIFIGEGALKQLKPFLQKTDSAKVLVVTDQGIMNAGLYENLEKVLNEAAQQIILFSDVEPDPSIELVKKVTALVEEEKVDVVIGIGGGSSIDTAKVAAALVNNEGDVDDYIGIDQLKNNSLQTD